MDTGVRKTECGSACPSLASSSAALGTNTTSASPALSGHIATTLQCAGGREQGKGPRQPDTGWSAHSSMGLPLHSRSHSRLLGSVCQTAIQPKFNIRKWVKTKGPASLRCSQKCRGMPPSVAPVGGTACVHTQRSSHALLRLLCQHLLVAPCSHRSVRALPPLIPFILGSSGLEIKIRIILSRG